VPRKVRRPSACRANEHHRFEVKQDFRRAMQSIVDGLTGVSRARRAAKDWAPGELVLRFIGPIHACLVERGGESEQARRKAGSLRSTRHVNHAVRHPPIQASGLALEMTAGARPSAGAGPASGTVVKSGDMSDQGSRKCSRRRRDCGPWRQAITSHRYRRIARRAGQTGRYALGRAVMIEETGHLPPAGFDVNSHRPIAEWALPA
jgi:hypothetical protein